MARRRQALAGPRGARVAATAAARPEEEAEAEEEEEGGVRAAGPRPAEEEAMNGDRTESDWQGLVSEVRPRRGPGGVGRAERPPAPNLRHRPPPSRVAEPGGDSQGTRTRGLDSLPPRPRQVRSSSRTFRSAPRHFLPRQLVPALGEGPSLRAGFGPGLEREARGSGSRSQAPPACPVATVLEPSDWPLCVEAERWCQGGNPGPGATPGQVESPAGEVWGRGSSVGSPAALFIHVLNSTHVLLGASCV